MVGFIGAAVDYSHANSVRTAMHQALDSTALMLSKEAATLTAAQLNAKATAYFNALYTRPEVTGIVITPTYTTTSGSQITVAGSGNVKAAFMGILGVSSITIHGTATVTWGQTRLRVALALDTTGSMADDGKMPALKTAAKSLISQLQGAAKKNGDIYVSIITFNLAVNVGKSNYNKSWVRWSGQADTWDENNGQCKNYSGWSAPTKKSTCLSNGGQWTVNNHNTWNGCVMDRDQDYDTTATAPSTSIKATQFPAQQYESCPIQQMGLSYNWGTLLSKIESLNAVGATNQVIGLQWAFQSLTGSPLTVPAKDPNYQYTDVIILMTDGLNTQTRFTNDRDEINAREKKVCANAKAAKITIYTIHVNTGGDPAQQVLKDCASDPSKYFEIKVANQMVTVFTQIGTALAQLRISK